MQIRILVTGGTFDKEYDELSGSMRRADGSGTKVTKVTKITKKTFRFVSFVSFVTFVPLPSARRSERRLCRLVSPSPAGSATRSRTSCRAVCHGPTAAEQRSRRSQRSLRKRFAL